MRRLQPRRRGLVTLAVATTLAIAACGSTKRVTHTSASNAGTTRRDQIVTSAAAALRGVHSYRITGSLVDALGPEHATVEFSAPDRLLVLERRSFGTAQLITIGATTYLKAPKSYYLHQHQSAAASRYGNRWLALPLADLPDAENTLTLYEPSNIARCLEAERESFTYAGTASVNGKPAVVLSTTGTVPGTAPGRAYFSVANPKVPVRSVVTGPRRPGGPAGCNPPHDTTTSIDETFGQVNQPIKITAPPHPLQLVRPPQARAL